MPYNTSATISWTASGDISSGCTLTGNGTTVWPPTTTSASIITSSLTTTTTFSLSCTGLGGTATQDLVVSVIPPPTPVMTISSLSPVAYNGSTTLSWVASGSDSCTLYKNNISQGSVNSISGSTSTGNMIADTTFLLACSGIGGTATTSPLTVKVLPPLSASISADSTLVPYNSSTYIRWDVAGAFSCTITKNSEPFNQMTYNTPTTITATTPVAVVYDGAGITSWISLPSTPPPSYLLSGPITKKTTFTEVCTNGVVSTTTSVIVDTIIPVTVSLSANPAYVSIGSSTTIFWSSTGADSCTITKNGVAFATGTSSLGISSGSINSITTFGAVCINSHATTSGSLIIVTEPIIEGTINPISITLTASPTSVESGSSTLIKWNALGAESCSITKDGSPFATGISNPGISSGILTATTTFAALCTNSYTPTKYTYNYSGNFTVPVGVNSITVETWGGGGGGAHTLNGGGGGGGGGGGYGKQTFNVNPGDTHSVIVGNGGGDDDGGETTSFGNLISATGGGGGKWLVWNCLSFCTTAAGAGGVSTAVINVSGSAGAAGAAPYQQYIPNLGYYIWIPGYGGAGGAGGNGGAGGAGGPSCSSGCHGGAGAAPGGGGGGGGVSMSTNNGGAGAKGRVIVTPGSGGTGINSVTKSITVAVTPPIIPITIDLNVTDSLILSGSSTTISWSSTNADSCEITKNGLPFATGISNLGISSGVLTATTTFAAMCINSGNMETEYITVNVTDNPEELGPINISSTCVPTQPAPFDGNIYVNRTTIWTATLGTTTLPTSISSSWSGTNISGTVSVNGNIFNKIYTTIGSKTINAIVTGTFGTKQFTSFCSTTTIVKLDTGGGGEI